MPGVGAAQMLADRGFQEVVNFAFVEEAWERDFAANENPIRLANPIASQMSVMRSTLIGGLVANVATNLKRKANPRARLRDRPLLLPRSAWRTGRGFSPAMEARGARLRHALPEQWGCADATSTSSTSRATSNCCSPHALLALKKPRTRRCIRAAARASGRWPGNRLHRRVAPAVATEVRPAAGPGRLRTRPRPPSSGPACRSTSRDRNSRLRPRYGHRCRPKTRTSTTARWP
jgi:hypothetical protein